MTKKVLFLTLGLCIFLQVSAQQNPAVVTPVDKTLKAGDTLSFLHITDLHTKYDQNSFPVDFWNSRKKYEHAQDHLSTLLNDITKQTKSAMVMATGDLVDFFELDVRGNQYLESQVKGFSGMIKKSPVPVYCSMGNHDMFSFFWKDGKLLHNQNSANRSRSYWIRNVPCFHNGTTYSKVFQIGSTTYRLIFLDNGLYEYHPEKRSEIPYIDKAQVVWLKEQLNESPDDVEIILMHIPFDEIKQGGEVENELFNILSKDPAVKLILAGHMHKNFVHVYPSADNQKLVEVQTGSLAKSIDCWRQIRLTEQNIMVSVPGKTQTELSIPAK